MHLRVGSRESPLALIQTESVVKALQAAHPDWVIEVKTFKTQGDLILDTALSKVGDKGLFVKELEAALLAGGIDLAVHSMKDMPARVPDGLALMSVGEREDPRDVLISATGVPLSELPPGAVVGTSSLRREAQLRRKRPDLDILNIRGNLHTRFRKLAEGPYQAIVLAAAGIHRLGWAERITQYFDPWTDSIPAVAQGILAVECRAGDCAVLEALEPIQNPVVEGVAQAERQLLAEMEGGCQLPLGAYCRWNGEAQRYAMRAVVFSPDGQRQVVGERQFGAHERALAVRSLADELKANGAADILAALQHH